MVVDVNSEDENDEHCDLGELEADVTKLINDFASWLYKQLESEYDYLCSDECVDQYLNDSDDEYDEDGSTI